LKSGSEVSAPFTLHATGLVWGEKGVLLLGPSGSGKSILAHSLIQRGRAQGVFARLVGDDRLILSRNCERLVMRPHPVLAGALESRGIGILNEPHEPAACLHLVLACHKTRPPRLPEPEDRIWSHSGLSVPCFAWQQGAPVETVLALLDVSFSKIMMT
jgi:HPr kinase/phosphorylase